MDGFSQQEGQGPQEKGSVRVVFIHLLLPICADERQKQQHFLFEFVARFLMWQPHWNQTQICYHILGFLLAPGEGQYMFPTVFLPFPWLFLYATCNLLAIVYTPFLFLTDPNFPPGRNPSLLMLLPLFSHLNLLLDSSAFHSLLVLSLVNSPILIKMLPVLSTERSLCSSAAFFYIIRVICNQTTSYNNISFLPTKQRW